MAYRAHNKLWKVLKSNEGLSTHLVEPWSMPHLCWNALINLIKLKKKRNNNVNKNKIGAGNNDMSMTLSNIWGCIKKCIFIFFEVS